MKMMATIELEFEIRRVAKDAKLRVIARKNRWVQVTNLGTSEKGWIYARHVATVR